MTVANHSAWQAKIRETLQYRQDTLDKVEPPLESLPSPLPLSSLTLPGAVLTPREISITELHTVPELLRKLASRAFTAEEVTRAFLRRSAIAQHATNCLTELLWDDAIERAKYLDSLPSLQGPLHGLPISTKENQGMRGQGKTCNSGYVAWIGSPCQPSPLHDMLWDAGCVFIARTTVPQTVMHLETNNNIYGRTVNPANRNHTCGGSSGGEGALLGMRGSLLGLGGDIGGSIRCPAAFNGVYGYKPTTSRFPGANSKAHMDGMESVLGVNGPLSTDRQGIEILMQTLLDARPWRIDPFVYPQPWVQHRFDRPLKVAVLWSDNIVLPHPPVLRALREVAAACKSAGMKVVNWDPLDHARAWDIVSALYFPDGGQDILNLLEQGDESPLPLTKFIINEQASVKNHSQKTLWELCKRREEFRAAYAHYWSKTDSGDGNEVDVILSPAYAGAAPPHDCARYWGYLAVWNLLDYPAITFPVTKVSAQDNKDDGYVPKNEQDRYNHDLYDKEKVPRSSGRPSAHRTQEHG
ncbi:hypothetical protein CEP52_014930 [Fusarium oligoseptatum]|uniref:amidase n=1 Tax=Fusarium oligoseptatum TaxID=2604345 RepID=A0A428SHU7_9HYPO|nr:hypothetical protein CEP52_014930 [Fusarium oligoseptatum]